MNNEKEDTSIIQNLPEDAKLILIRNWFRCYDGPDKLTRDTHAKLEKESSCRFFNGFSREPVAQAQITKYFKSLLPKIVSSITAEEMYGQTAGKQKLDAPNIAQKTIRKFGIRMG